MEKFWVIIRQAIEKMFRLVDRLQFLILLIGTVIVVGVILFVKPWDQQRMIDNMKSFVENLRDEPSTQTLITSPATSMKITSPAFAPDATIPSQFTCDGKDMSPPLQIQDVPSGTKSLALIVHDPDAPHPGGWTHWILWNIPPQTAEIAENAVPAGALQGRTDFGGNKWGGPCPPSGTHHYRFMLYALDTMLDLPAATTKADLEKAMSGHTLAQNTLTGLYSRK